MYRNYPLAVGVEPTSPKLVKYFTITSLITCPGRFLPINHRSTVGRLTDSWSASSRIGTGHACRTCRNFSSEISSTLIVPLVYHKLGANSRIRTDVTRATISCPNRWTIPAIQQNFGAPGGIRTHALPGKSRMLSRPLSYEGIWQGWRESNPQ